MSRCIVNKLVVDEGKNYTFSLHGSQIIKRWNFFQSRSFWHFFHGRFCPIKK